MSCLWDAFFMEEATLKTLILEPGIPSDPCCCAWLLRWLVSASAFDPRAWRSFQPLVAVPGCCDGLFLRPVFAVLWLLFRKAMRVTEAAAGRFQAKSKFRPSQATKHSPMSRFFLRGPPRGRKTSQIIGIVLIVFLAFRKQSNGPHPWSKGHTQKVAQLLLAPENPHGFEIQPRCK